MKVVILPGLDGTGLLSSGIHEHLSSDFDVQVLAYPPDLSRYSDIQSWIEERLPGEDYALVAESFSGPLAARIASSNPPNLKTVIFVATFVHCPRPLPTFVAHALKLLPIKFLLVVRLAQPLLMGRWANADFTSVFRRALGQVPVASLVGRLREVLQIDVRSDLSAISVPMLYLRAGNDWLVPQRMSVDFERAGAELIELDGPHFLLQARAVEAAISIRDYMARVSF